MSSSQTELVELSDPRAESNVEDTLAQTPPKKKVNLVKSYVDQVTNSNDYSITKLGVKQRILDIDNNFLLNRI